MMNNNDNNDPLIQKWKKLYESFADRSGNFEVKVITDKAIIRGKSHEIFSLLQDSYIDKGGFKGSQFPKDVWKNTDLMKVVFDKSGEILAFALYRTSLGGKKRFGSGCNRANSDHKAAVRAIIKSDIYPYDNWYWIEASGPIERYFKQMNGNPIPNYLVKDFLKADEIDDDIEIILLDDGVHYKRAIGADRELLTKMMFSFKNQQIYDKVINSVADYTNFKSQVNKHMESIFTEDKSDKSKAAYVARKIFEFYDEWGFREMLPEWHENLIWAIGVLEKILNDGTVLEDRKMYESLLNHAKNCLEDMPILKCHQFHIEDADL